MWMPLSGSTREWNQDYIGVHQDAVVEWREQSRIQKDHQCQTWTSSITSLAIYQPVRLDGTVRSQKQWNIPHTLGIQQQGTVQPNFTIEEINHTI